MKRLVLIVVIVLLNTAVWANADKAHRQQSNIIPPALVIPPVHTHKSLCGPDETYKRMLQCISASNFITKATTSRIKEHWQYPANANAEEHYQELLEKTARYRGLKSHSLGVVNYWIGK